jgi:hypothetical protein
VDEKRKSGPEEGTKGRKKVEIVTKKRKNDKKNEWLMAGGLLFVRRVGG